MKKKKVLKLKKEAYYILAGFVGIIVLGILGLNMYNTYKYKQTDEFKIIEKGYSLDESKVLTEHLSHEQIMKILEKEKNETIISLVQEKYFLWKNLDDYLEYIEKEKTNDLKDVVAIINVHAQHKWYQVNYETDISLNETMNVNKFYALKEDYVPENLKTIGLTYSYGNLGDNKLIDYAYEKFIDLWEAAHDEGYYLMVNFSYRDYKSQKSIYEDYQNTLGERKADELAARPLHSEHQTGLVVDMTSQKNSLSKDFTGSEEHKWLQENAHKYGFIERYPEGKTYLTGYAPESWHWRYVGVDIATKMHEEGITFDEYYAYYIEK